MQYALRFSVLPALIFFAALLLIPQASHAATVTISMGSMQFSPKSATAQPGDTIKWVNNDTVAHTVTADDGSFDSGTINPGQSFSVVFRQAGTYRYYCAFHGGTNGQGMSGVVTVGDAGTPPSAGNAQTSNSSVTASQSTNTNVNTGTSASASASGTSAYQSQLYAQAQALLLQVQQLQQQYGVTGSVSGTQTTSGGVVLDSSSCPLIGRSLKRGVSGDDVLRLQAFLARDPSVYPEGQVTGYYGALTEAAVQRWQAKYNVVSTGSPETTGYGVVGPRTAAAIALLCTTGSGTGTGGTPTQNTGGGPAGDFMTVSPTGGPSPLTVNVAVTVNTSHSCDSRVYVLDFGDGTLPRNVYVPQGYCAQLVQSFPHQYGAAGTYQVRLSINGQATTALVQVTQGQGTLSDTLSGSPPVGNAPLVVNFSGVINSAAKCFNGPYSVVFGDGSTAALSSATSSCAAASFSLSHQYTTSGTFTATLYNGATSVQNVTITVGGSSSSNAPSGTISAFTTSGTAPLPVSFYVSCANAVAYNVVFGDGTDLGGGNLSQTSCGGLQSVSHTYTAPGDYTVQLVVFSAGSFTPTSVATTTVSVTQSSNLVATPSTGGAPLTVTFTGSVTSGSSCPSNNYRIEFGDGASTPVSTLSTGTPCIASLFSVQHQYTNVGTYTASLYNGTAKVGQAGVTVTQGASSFSAGVTSGTVPLPVTFYVSCANAAAYNVVFGDGTDLGGSGVSQTSCGGGLQSVSHTYTLAGTYTAQLVTFAQGTFTPSTAAQLTITVGSGTALSANPTSGQAPLSVTFTGNAAGTSYTLSFGDGSTTQTGSCSTSGCVSTPVSTSHTYSTAGTYTAQLSGSGSSITRSVTITVSAAPTAYTYNPPVVSVSGPLGFVAQFDLPSACTGFDLSWGDNTSHVIQTDGGNACAQSALVVSQSHTYAHTGTYTMLLKRGPTLSRSDNVSITVQ